ncbi:MAG: HNH endonuclease family protein [Rhodococcus sp. (in: high G+C Gram-positive bacteria)]
MSRRRAGAVTPIGAVIVAAVAAAGWWLSGTHPTGTLAAPDTDAASVEATSVWPAADRNQSPIAASTTASVDELIAGLTVFDELPDVAGYDRGCGTDKKTGAREGCVFGPAWTDDYDGPSSHDGCDTRNNLLAIQLRDVVFKPGTRDCKVTSGTLDDPYTGRVISFTSGRDTSSAVQADHVFALSRAWDAGAASWTLDRRTAFANDTSLNLLAVDGPTNNSKSDSGLDGWLPPNLAFGCDYAIRYLTVASVYDLAVTAGDVATAHAVCGSPAGGVSR